MTFKSLPAILLCLLLACSVRAEEKFKYLHVSTNPSYADAYTSSISKNFASNPDYKLPGFIKVQAGEPNVLLTLFKPGFKDTTINVTLSEADTSYLIVALTPTYDDAYLEFQQNSLSHRSRKNIGHKLMIASAFPLLASGIAAIVTQYNIEQAKDRKDLVEKSVIHEGEEYSLNFERFDSYCDKAETARKTTLATFIAGASLLTFGIILSF